MGEGGTDSLRQPVPKLPGSTPDSFDSGLACVSRSRPRTVTVIVTFLSASASSRISRCSENRSSRACRSSHSRAWSRWRRNQTSVGFHPFSARTSSAASCRFRSGIGSGRSIDHGTQRHRAASHDSNAPSGRKRRGRSQASQLSKLSGAVPGSFGIGRRRASPPLSVEKDSGR